MRHIYLYFGHLVVVHLPPILKRRGTSCHLAGVLGTTDWECWGHCPGILIIHGHVELFHHWSEIVIPCKVQKGLGHGGTDSVNTPILVLSSTVAISKKTWMKAIMIWTKQGGQRGRGQPVNGSIEQGWSEEPKTFLWLPAISSFWFESWSQSCGMELLSYRFWLDCRSDLTVKAVREPIIKADLISRPKPRTFKLRRCRLCNWHLATAAAEWAHEAGEENHTKFRSIKHLFTAISLTWNVSIQKVWELLLMNTTAWMTFGVTFF